VRQQFLDRTGLVRGQAFEHGEEIGDERKSGSDHHGTRLSPKRAESGCVARKSEPRPVPENRAPTAVCFRRGKGCGAGGSRPHTVRCAAKNRPTAPSATAPRKSVLDSDSHVFGLTECHEGQTRFSQTGSSQPLRRAARWVGRTLTGKRRWNAGGQTTIFSASASSLPASR